MVVDLQELAQRMLADYDARTPGSFVGEPVDLTTAQAYALQTEVARLREQRGEKVIGSKVGGCAGSGPVLQPIMPLDLPVKIRSWELTVYPRSHIRR